MEFVSYERELLSNECIKRYKRFYPNEYQKFSVPEYRHELFLAIDKEVTILQIYVKNTESLSDKSTRDEIQQKFVEQLKTLPEMISR